MGNLKAAFDSVTYSIALLAGTLVVAMVFGVFDILGPLFSLGGFITFFFIVFTSTAK